MKRATLTATFASNIDKVWRVVTDNSSYIWRSDLSKIVVAADGNSFTEYTKDNIETQFIITLKKPKERYEFDIKNKNMSGHWVGVFTQTKAGTQIVFTEEVNVSNPIMNLFVGKYLKNQQQIYVQDLKKALGE